MTSETREGSTWEEAVISKEEMGKVMCTTKASSFMFLFLDLYYA